MKFKSFKDGVPEAAIALIRSPKGVYNRLFVGYTNNNWRSCWDTNGSYIWVQADRRSMFDWAELEGCLDD
jgi:hypothetical protein